MQSNQCKWERFLNGSITFLWGVQWKYHIARFFFVASLCSGYKAYKVHNVSGNRIYVQCTSIYNTKLSASLLTLYFMYVYLFSYRKKNSEDPLIHDSLEAKKKKHCEVKLNTRFMCVLCKVWIKSRKYFDHVVSAMHNSLIITC